MKGFVALLRPLNCFMVVTAVYIGALVASGPLGIQLHIIDVLMASLVAFLFTGAGNALNDYFDRDIDRINHPGRPIPSGKVSPDSVLLFAFVLFLVSLVLATFINIIVTFIVVANLAVMISYEVLSKAKGLAGNMTIAWLTGTTFLFGGAAVGAIGDTVILAALAFLATLGREIAKDIEDIEGDVGRDTVPMQAGVGNAQIMAGTAIFASILLSPLPQLLGLFLGSGLIYYILSIAAADAIFIYCIFLLAKGKEHASFAIKGGMLIALVAFLLGGILQGI
jgi:geranylgeranylglycerol-phosphate geranylgeranyltransferase